MASHGRALGLGAVAVAAAAWALGAAATMAENPAPPLPSQLLGADVQVRVAGEQARVTVHHDFRALFDAPAGGVVFLALPAGAAVEDVRLAVEGRPESVAARLGETAVAVTLPPLPAGRRFSVDLAYLHQPARVENGASRLELPALASGATEAPLTVDAVVAEPLTAVASPSHRIVGAATEAGGTWLTLRDGAVPADRAFVLEWHPAQVAAGS